MAVSNRPTDHSYAAEVEREMARRLSALDRVRRLRVDYGSWAAALMAVDWLCSVLATVLAFPASELWLAAVALPGSWICLTGFFHLYERQYLGPGSDEFRRVLRAALIGTGCAAAIGAVALHSDHVLRAVLIVLPLSGLLSIVARRLLRRLVSRLDRTNVRRAIVVGSAEQGAALAHVLRRSGSGVRAVAAMLTSEPSDGNAAETSGLPVLGILGDPPDVDTIATAVSIAKCDTVIVLPGPHLSAMTLSRLSWRSERDGVELLVAPFLTDIAVSRLAIRDSGGVPLLHVRAPRVSRRARLPKDVAERFGAVLGLILLSPVFAAISLAILLSDGRPVFFRQRRVGLHGEEFTMVKFRTMRAGADARKAELQHLNVNADGPLFKARADPRVTRVGAVLRRYSLDELPQLLNVAAGSMSLVGPRPPLPEEAAKFGPDVRNRLLVKPGLTGLWQISGGSDLSWADAVRLDLGYVENWSLALDAEILLRTGSAVVKGTGAY
jgi:exopolysaccharide biosynthesis polyprenyl glycosylphosphotransferase